MKDNVMKKQEKIDLISSCIGTDKILRTYFKYDENYWYYYPNAVSEHLILGQEENDFELDGYHIRKISDLKKAEVKFDLCEQINVWKGVTKEIKNPNVDITSWQTVFRSPVLQGRFIIVEDENNEVFRIGLIRKVCARYMLLDSFDADGIFEDAPYAFPYSKITHVAWDTRYSENWYQYMRSHSMLS